MRDKAISDMAEILCPVAESVIATRPANPRSASPEEIRDAASRTGTEIELMNEVPQALARAQQISRTEPSAAKAVIVITGSIYLVGEAMQFFGLQPE